MPAPLTVGIVLFEGFELLDVFGPCEAYGSLHLDGAFKLVTVAEHAGPIASAQGPSAVADFALNDAPHLDLLLVPGGIGTRREVNNAALHDWLRTRSTDATLVTSVCTG